jgi:hypothetical protein
MMGIRKAENLGYFEKRMLFERKNDKKDERKKKSSALILIP